MRKDVAIEYLRSLAIGDSGIPLAGSHTAQAVRCALNVAIECMENPVQAVAPPADDDARLRLVRVMNLLGDIVKEATEKPDRLTSFNSPLLQLACMEIYGYFNPDEPVDEKSKEIFRQMAMVGYNV